MRRGVTHKKVGLRLTYQLVALRWKISENPGITTRTLYFAAKKISGFSAVPDRSTRIWSGPR